MLTYEKAIELFEYCPASGVIRWKVSCGNAKNGDVAGRYQKQKQMEYLRIYVDGAKYLAHRIAWLIYFGELPQQKITHLDRNGLNNMIENLVEASRGNNTRRLLSSKESGRNGVEWNIISSKWDVFTNLKGQRQFVGRFDTIDDAVDARRKALQEFLGRNF